MAGKDPRGWSNEDFRRFTDQVLCYEVQQLYSSILGLGVIDQRDPHWNALVESLAVHTRNLIEFLSHPPQGNRVTASHFGVVLDGKRFERLYGQVSAQVAHVTAERLDLTEERKTYDPAQIRDLMIEVSRFLDASVPEKIGDEFRRLVIAVRKRLAIP